MRVRTRGGSWLVALVSAVLLMLGSALMAAAASAAPQRGHGWATHSEKGHPEKGHPEKRHAVRSPRRMPSTHRSPRSAASGRGQSGVALPSPNQYQSQSDPDGMENGGVDQPGGSGGVNPDAQDGNNGSGNDIDCEDDNRGRGMPGHCTDHPGTCAHPGHGHAYGRVHQCAAAPAPGEDAGVAGSPGAGATSPTGAWLVAGSAPVFPVGLTAVLGSTGAQPAASPAFGSAAQGLGVGVFAAPSHGAPAAPSHGASILRGADAGATVPTVVDAGVAGSPLARMLPRTSAHKALLALVLAGVAASAAGAAMMLRDRRRAGVVL